MQGLLVKSKLLSPLQLNGWEQDGLDKKNLQKKYQRFSKEGQNLWTYEEIDQDVRGLLAELGLEGKKHYRLTIFVMDLIDRYRVFLSSALSKQTAFNNFSYLVEVFAPQLALSVFRLDLLLRIDSSELLLPQLEKFWFLPSRNTEGVMTWPITKLLKALMEGQGLRDIDDFLHRIESAYEYEVAFGGVDSSTVKKWFNGIHLPSKTESYKFIKAVSLSFKDVSEVNLKLQFHIAIFIEDFYKITFSKLLKDEGLDEVNSILADCFNFFYEKKDAFIKQFDLLDNSLEKEQMLNATLAKVEKENFRDTWEILDEEAEVRNIYFMAFSNFSPSSVNDALQELEQYGAKRYHYYRLGLKAFRAVFDSKSELEFKKAIDLFLETLEESRLKDGEFVRTFIRTAVAVACTSFEWIKENKQKREKVYKSLITLRKWSLLYFGSDTLTDLKDKDLSEEQERLFLEKGRRYFYEVFGKYLDFAKPKFDRFDETFATCLIDEIQEKEEVSQRHPNQVNKDKHFRDNSKLMTLISDGKNRDKEEILKLITNEKCDLNFLNSNNDHAFSYAMSQLYWTDRYEIAEAILKRESREKSEFDISVKTLNSVSKAKKCSALRDVIEQGQVGLLKLLIEKGVDLNQRFDSVNITPLYYAVQCLRQDLSKEFFLRSCRTLTQQKVTVESMSLLTADWGNDEDRLEIVKLLLQHGAKVDAENVNGFTALIYATELQLIKAIQVLLSNGAEVNARVKGGGTAIMHAAIKNDLAAAQTLIGAGAYCDIRNVINRSPLDYCRSQEMRDLIQEGIDQGNCYYK